jgi:hypothetical protein
MNGFASRQLLVLALLLTSAASVLAQQNSLSIKGTVTDQLGGLVVGATVVAKDSKGNSVSVTTNDDGIYQFHNLLPGRYDLIVTAAGFSTLDEKNVELKSGKPLVKDMTLAIGSVETIVTIDNKSVSTDSDRNADALVLGLKELEALPTDPDALAATLQAMAGPIGDEGGGQASIKVDGFSNGKIPPKEQIREVRFNQNPYSAENEYPGWGGIEIYTQPGSDKFHGNASFNFNDESLNSRNPFALVRAPFQLRSWNVNVTGPLRKKRSSFNVGFYRSASDSNAIINATTLDLATLKPLTVNQTIVMPSVFDELDLRGDFKLNKKHTLIAAYEYDNSYRDPGGVGGFNLASRAYRSESIYHQVQVTETAMINEKMVNETRFRLTHSVDRQTAKNAIPALNVSESFNGGGSQVGKSSNRQDRLEVQNFTSWQAKKHFVKIGGRLRYVSINSISPSNFGGTYTFSGGAGPALDANDQIIPGAAPLALSSLERYRRTLAFQRAGFSADQIRLLGGGATQLSIAGGNPEADVTQSDVGFYIQDDWKLRQHLTISPGLRYENQTNIDSNLNFAPRVGFAWSPMFLAKKPPAPPTVAPAAAATANKPVDPKSAATTPADAKSTAAASTAPATPAAPPRQPTIVIRGGIGIFYNRISEDYTLSALRFNGTTQQQFVVTDPAVLGLFPAIPPIEALNAFKLPQTRRQLSADLTPSTALRGSVSFEQQLGKKYRYSIGYTFARGLHTMRTVNINAPLGGTFDPLKPTSGVRPLGKSAGNILENQSNGRNRSDSINVSASGSLFKIGFWANYSWSSTRNLDGGSSGSPTDAFDFSNEWGRASYDTHHRFYMGMNWQTKTGWSVNPFVAASSGQPFNITTGHDTNGDNAFSERPAFATDLTKPGVMITPYGALDPNPAAGAKIIPRNFGQGPAFFSANIGVSKTWKFGKAIQAKSPPANAAVVVATPTPTVASGKPAPKPEVQRPFAFQLSLYANNVLNRNNRGNLIGNMASPYFLRSTSTFNQFYFGPGGGSGGNRSITVRLRLNF